MRVVLCQRKNGLLALAELSMKSIDRANKSSSTVSIRFRARRHISAKLRAPRRIIRRVDDAIAIVIAENGGRRKQSRRVV